MEIMEIREIGGSLHRHTFGQVAHRPMNIWTAICLLGHSTVTLLARLRGWSTSRPRAQAIV
jgi:hypothetical protein